MLYKYASWAFKVLVTVVVDITIGVLSEYVKMHHGLQNVNASEVLVTVVVVDFTIVVISFDVEIKIQNLGFKMLLPQKLLWL